MGHSVVPAHCAQHRPVMQQPIRRTGKASCVSLQRDRRFTPCLIHLNVTAPILWLQTIHDRQVALVCSCAPIGQFVGADERGRPKAGRVRSGFILLKRPRRNGERRRHAPGRFYRRASDAAIRNAGGRRQPRQRTLDRGADHRPRPFHRRKNNRCVAGCRTRTRHFRFDASLPHDRINSGRSNVQRKLIWRAANASR